MPCLSSAGLGVPGVHPASEKHLAAQLLDVLLNAVCRLNPKGPST